MEGALKLVSHCKREPYDVLIDRTTIYGNPFSHKELTRAKFKVASREEAISRFAEWVLTQPSLLVMIKRDLPGKILGCWCRPTKGFCGRLLCHGQILAGIANNVSPYSLE